MIKRTLSFNNPAYLSLTNKQMVIKLPEIENSNLSESFKAESVRTVPVEDIGIVVLDDKRITITQGLLEALLENDCAVITCDKSHLPVGLMLPLCGNTIQNEIFKLIKDSKSIDETRYILKEHQKELYDITNNKLKELNYDQDFTIHYGYNYFPKKKYKGITYKEGNYESLVITLGKGSGDNFWCVLFPPLCLLETDESNSSDVEYTFFVKELIYKYLKK